MKFIKFLIPIILVLIIISLAMQRGIQVDFSYDGEFSIGEPIQIHIEVKNNGQYYTPDHVEIEIYSRYNSEDYINFVLEPYDQGKYMLVVTPKYGGDYYINLTILDGTMTYLFTDSYNIK